MQPKLVYLFSCCKISEKSIARYGPRKYNKIKLSERGVGCSETLLKLYQIGFGGVSQGEKLKI